MSTIHLLNEVSSSLCKGELHFFSVPPGEIAQDSGEDPHGYRGWPLLTVWEMISLGKSFLRNHETAFLLVAEGTLGPQLLLSPLRIPVTMCNQL